MKTIKLALITATVIGLAGTQQAEAMTTKAEKSVEALIKGLEYGVGSAQQSPTEAKIVFITTAAAFGMAAYLTGKMSQTMGGKDAPTFMRVAAYPVSMVSNLCGLASFLSIGALWATWR